MAGYLVGLKADELVEMMAVLWVVMTVEQKVGPTVGCLVA
jgi:hypothetical protein